MSEHFISKDIKGRILLPDSYEIWECDHKTGSFLGIPLGGIVSAVDLDAAFDGLLKDPEMKDKQLIKVKCTRRITEANFDYQHVLGLPITIQDRDRGRHTKGNGKC